MRIGLIAAGFAACLATGTVAVAAAGDMNAETFYTQGMAVKDKGMAALLDKRTKPLISAMKDAGKRVKAENDLATKRGSPLYCVPAAAKKKGMNVDMVFAELGTIPQSQRKTLSVVNAWRKILIRKYPC